MSPLLESIYLSDGIFRNLNYHEARMKNSCQVLFNHKLKIDLATLLSGMSYPSIGIYKTRIIYSNSIHRVEFVPYRFQGVSSLKIVHSHIQYSHKFLDRSELDSLYLQRGSADDVLIVKDGFITDSYYANLIFKKESRWFTPQTCLLKGTMLQSLLDAEQIEEAQISLSNFNQYQSVKLINSMLGINSLEIPVTSIS